MYCWQRWQLFTTAEDQGQPVIPAKQLLKTEAREHMEICAVINSESRTWRLNNSDELEARQNVKGKYCLLPMDVHQYNSVTIR